jgi:hypothetical protein
MPKISSYTTTAPSLTDKLIGTDTTDNSATKNFSVSSVLELSNSNSFNLVLESNTGNDDQTASAINTATTILLGGAKSGTGVALDSAGNITFSTEGKYYVQLLVNSGSIANNQSFDVKSIYFNSYKNNIEYGIAIQDSLALVTGQVPTTEGLSINIIFNAAINDVLNFKFSVGSLIMGLRYQASTVGSARAAAIKIYKI